MSGLLDRAQYNSAWRVSTRFRLMRLLLASGLSVAAAACGSDTGRIKLTVGGETFDVELAVTAEQRRQGLMFREQLGEREGMLFVLEQEQNVSFWMRDTPLALSIAFIDARGVIVHVADMVPYSEAPVPSRFPVRYALEVNQGAFERAGIEVGALVEIPEHLR